MKVPSRLASAHCPHFLAEDGSVAVQLSTPCVDSALKADYGRCYSSSLAWGSSISGLSVALVKHLRPKRSLGVLRCLHILELLSHAALASLLSARLSEALPA